MNIYLIRHGKTYGNTLGRYIGARTDESLCEEGIADLRGKKYPSAERVYISPMKRCLETARFLWPDHGDSFIKLESLKECDFGDFENKNYQELSGNADYQAWIDSGGTLPFPNGESMEEFKARCIKGFCEILQKEGNSINGNAKKSIAIVAHGGTIMAILEAFGAPKKNYFDYQVKNGCGYLLTPVEGTERWNYRSLP